MPPAFDTFFRQANASEQNPKRNSPYDYQRRLACGEPSRTACPCASQLNHIPTGLGKTA